jgi:hypothetical protein
MAVCSSFAHSSLYPFARAKESRVIKSRRLRQVRHVVHMGKMRNAFRILVRKPDGKRTFGINGG